MNAQNLCASYHRKHFCQRYFGEYKKSVDSGPGNLVSNTDSVFMVVNNDEKGDLLCPIGQKGL